MDLQRTRRAPSRCQAQVGEARRAAELRVELNRSAVVRNSGVVSALEMVARLLGPAA